MMNCMDDAGATVIAAIAAGAFGILGTFAGMVVGRRQTTDQAQVEHGQWLRGQRQQAYVEFLNAWQAAVDQLHQCGIRVMLDLQSAAESNVDQQAARFQLINDETYQAVSSIQATWERVDMLGPMQVERTAAELRDLLSDMADAILAACPGSTPGAAAEDPEMDRFQFLFPSPRILRFRFVTETREVMRTAPQPGPHW